MLTESEKLDLIDISIIINNLNGFPAGPDLKWFETLYYRLVQKRNGPFLRSDGMWV